MPSAEMIPKDHQFGVELVGRGMGMGWGMPIEVGERGRDRGGADQVDLESSAIPGPT